VVPEEDPGGGTLFVIPAQPLARMISSRAPNPRAMRLRRLAVRPTRIAKDRAVTTTRRAISEGSDVIGRMSSDRAVVVIETDTEETPMPLGVTEDGVTAHAESLGAPLQINEIGWLKPPSGLIARVRLTDWPAFTIAELGETEREKSCPVPERLAV
jgi:hypothetical protein